MSGLPEFVLEQLCPGGAAKLEASCQQIEERDTFFAWGSDFVIMGAITYRFAVERRTPCPGVGWVMYLANIYTAQMERHEESGGAAYGPRGLVIAEIRRLVKCKIARMRIVSAKLEKMITDRLCQNQKPTA